MPTTYFRTGYFPPGYYGAGYFPASDGSTPPATTTAIFAHVTPAAGRPDPNRSTVTRA
jgi:hypothetical protein